MPTGFSPCPVRLQHLGEDLERDLRWCHAPQVETDRAAHLVGERAELFAALRLGATRAQGADKERSSFDTGSQARDVKPLLVHQRDERGVGVDLDLVRPGHDDLVCTRHALRRREPGSRVDDGRVPSERPRKGAQRLCDIAGADGDELRRRRHRLDEQRAVVLFAETGRVPRRVVPALPDSLAGDDHVARAPRELGCPAEPLDENVDLTAARQPDRPRLLVGDPVGDDLCRVTGDDRLRALRDICFDAAA